MTLLRAAVSAVLLSLGFFASLAAAQEISLRAKSGTFGIEGKLLGYDGRFLRIDTIYGPLTLDGDLMICSGAACPDPDTFAPTLRISGSATIGTVVMPALLESFARRKGLIAQRDSINATDHVYVLRNRAEDRLVATFRFHVTNTDEGFADLLAEDADAVMALRDVRAEEADAALDIGLGDLRTTNRGRVLALDALVPVVAGGNPLETIDLSDLARIVAGELTNWSELGGPDAPIRVHLPARSSGLSQTIGQRLLDPVSLSPMTGAMRHASPKDIDAAVAEDRMGIGLTTFSAVSEARPLAFRGTCGFEQRTMRRMIKSEDHPLTAPLYLYVPARRLPEIMRDFLAFTRSPAAQLVIRRAGFVDQTPEEIGLEAQGVRLSNAISAVGSQTALRDLQRMVARLSSMKRLTTSFRFTPGSTSLDAQSQSNVQQLAHALEAGLYNEKELFFVGFSDGQGSASANQAISQRRAEAVAEAVRRAAKDANFDRITLRRLAFGERLPMACDDTPWGRQVNRRVEVWVR